MLRPVAPTTHRPLIPIARRHLANSALEMHLPRLSVVRNINLQLFGVSVHFGLRHTTLDYVPQGLANGLGLPSLGFSLLFSASPGFFCPLFARTLNLVPIFLHIRCLIPYHLQYARCKFGHEDHRVVLIIFRNHR